MALNIKNPEVDRLAAEIAASTGETKTEVIRQALLMRLRRLGLPSSEERWDAIRTELERGVWSRLPPTVRGHGLSKEQQDEAVGFGPEGY